jgi:hypothetical protein
MEKATPENVKPGVWLRTSKEDRKYDPDVIFRCKKIIWKGDGHPNNYIMSEVFFDYEEGEWLFDDPQAWEHIQDMGLRPNEAEWNELLGSYDTYSNHEIVKMIFEDPISRW